LIFSYDPPIINSIVSSTPDANGALVSFRGKNFGFVELPIEVIVGNLTCSNPTWLNDGKATCTTSADVVGPKNISFLAANRTSPVTVHDFQQFIVALCQGGGGVSGEGYYGVRGQMCTKCPLGALCPGGELDTDLVVSSAGYWKSSPAGARVYLARSRDAALIHLSHVSCNVSLQTLPLGRARRHTPSVCILSRVRLLRAASEETFVPRATR
jgi:hypothetical protein